MKNSGKDIDLSNKPKLRINLRQGDLRTGPKDRRKIHTYVANDRRSGIADRRKTQSKSNS
jgi:hypothetical protein